MAYEGATLYYRSPQNFNIEIASKSLSNLGLYLEHPENRLISGFDKNIIDFSIPNKESFFSMFNGAYNFSVHLWFKVPARIFLNFSTFKNCFICNFSFN